MLLSDFTKVDITNFIDTINFKELKTKLNSRYDMHIKKILPTVVYHNSGEIYINLEIFSNIEKYMGICQSVFDEVRFKSYCCGLAIDNSKIVYTGNIGIEFFRKQIYSIANEGSIRLNFISFQWDGRNWEFKKYNEF